MASSFFYYYYYYYTHGGILEKTEQNVFARFFSLNSSPPPPPPPFSLSSSSSSFFFLSFLCSFFIWFVAFGSLVLCFTEFLVTLQTTSCAISFDNHEFKLMLIFLLKYTHYWLDHRVSLKQFLASVVITSGAVTCDRDPRLPLC